MLFARRYLGDLRWIGPSVARYFVAIVLVGFAVDGGVYAALLNLYLNRIGYGPEDVGLVNAVGMLVFACASLPAGFFGERWGSRRIMLIGLGLLAGCGTLLPLADLLPVALRMPWLLGLITGLYLGLSLYFVNTAPILLALVSSEQCNQAYATQTALIALAAFVGSLAGGLLPPLISDLIKLPLSDPAPYRYGLMIAGLAITPALLVISSLHTAEVHSASAASLATPSSPTPAASSMFRLLVLIALSRMLQLAGLATITTFFNLYLDSALHIPVAQIGLLLALGRLSGVPAALATAALSLRFGNRSVVITASLLTAIGILPMTLIPHWLAAGFSLMAVVSLSSIRYAASMVYFLDLVPPTRRATVVGVTEMSAGVCFTAMTYGGGYIIALCGYQTLFMLSAAITACSALTFWLSFRRR
ncbi:MAG: MFS transporter [Oscillochloris sp.]|nr:MFS transporter [Oscillochloris sp.]